MQTITLKKEDLKHRPDMGEDWYEWAGGTVEGNIRWEEFNVIITRRGYLDCGGYLYCGGDLNWSLASMPTAKEIRIKNPIRPPEYQREHWEKRTGLALSGCYEEIHERVRDKIPALLKKKCWSETERWILESWK